MGNRTWGMIEMGMFSSRSVFIVLPSISEMTLKFINNISKKWILEGNKHFQERQKNFGALSYKI